LWLRVLGLLRVLWLRGRVLRLRILILGWGGGRLWNVEVVAERSSGQRVLESVVLTQVLVLERCVQVVDLVPML
jgi:hypothetical protein